MSPTIKQSRALTNLVENGGNVSRAMRAAGYSEAMCKNPQKFTKSIGFTSLVDKHFPDEGLLIQHSKVLMQDRDLTNKMRAIETGYKLKRRYDDESSGDIQVNIVFV